VNTKIASLVLIFIIVPLTAGCLQPRGQIGFTGDMNVTNRTFTMNGEIVDGSAPNPTYENVTVYLYTEDGELITQRRVGTFNRSSEPFMIQSETVPHYIIIDSPTFWELNDVGVTYYERNRAEGYYASNTIEKQAELPVDPPS